MGEVLSDQDLFATLKERLFTAVVGDVLDRMGLMRQFLPAQIRPSVPGTRFAGRAMPVLETDVYAEGTAQSGGPLARKPFGLMFEALDNLKQDEVYVATGASLRYALFGELMATRARMLGAAGAVLNGYVRDKDGINALGFPCFSQGAYAQDQGPRGKVIDFRTGIEIGGVSIMPGDLMFGDDEGVLVIPKQAEQEAVRLALEKAADENRVADAIKGGMGAAEAFAKFGVM